jgi:hypothetical protein
LTNGTASNLKVLPGMGSGKRRAVEGVNSSLINLIHYKNFYKLHNVLLPSITIKKRKSSAYGRKQLSK